MNGGGIVVIEIMPGVGHFKQERPGYNKLVT